MNPTFKQVTKTRYVQLVSELAQEIFVQHYTKLTPKVAAALAEGETRLVNVPQARVKETDRIAVMTAELTKMGARIEELPDGMVIRGGSLHGAKVHSHGDHRIGMALAVAGLAARGETVVGEIEAAEVTYPDFVRDFRALGAEFELIPEND